MNKVVCVCCFFTAVSVFFFAHPGWAEQVLFEEERRHVAERINIYFYADRNEVVEGEELKLRFGLSWVGNNDLYRLDLPKFKVHNFAIKNISQSEETVARKAGNTSHQTYIYELKALKAGTAVIDEFEFRYYRKGTTHPYIASIPACELYVLEDKAAPYFIIFLLCLIFIFIVGTGVIIKKHMKHIARRNASATQMDTAKEDEALKALEQLKPLIKNKEEKEAMIQLAPIMRNYLIEKFGGYERTEIIPFIDTISDIISADKTLLKKLFAVCEEVKYAGYTYESGKIQSLLNAATEFIKSRKVT